MHSILSRFRTRAISQTTTDSSQSGPGPITPTNLTTDPHVFPPSTPAKPFVSPIERKIYPDVNSLLEEYSAQPSPIDNTPSRRHSIDGVAVTPLRPRRPSLPITQASPVREEEEARTRSDTPSSVAQSAKAGGSRFLSRISSITAPGEWSTFGRVKKADTSIPSEFGEQPSAWRSRVAKSKERGGSTRSSTTQNRSRPSTGPTASSKTPSRKSSDRHLNVDDKENSDVIPSPPSSQPQSDAYTPSSGRPRSNTTPGSHAQSFSSRFARISTPVARQLGFDSPRTFGHPSPHNRGRPDASPPPPLPPLDHPELAATLLPRSQPDAMSKPLDTALFPQSKTFPPRTGGADARQRSHSNREEAEPHWPENRAIRPYRSMPRAQHIFHSSASKASSQPLTSSRSPRSTRHGRRVSADLFARQAASGVAADNRDEPAQGWAARVSQEMIRLALDGGDGNPAGGSGGRAGPAAETGNKDTARGRSGPPASPSQPQPTSFPAHPPAIPPLSPSLFASFGLDASPKRDFAKYPDGLPSPSVSPLDTSTKREDKGRAGGMQDPDQSFQNRLRSTPPSGQKPLRSSLRVKSATGPGFASSSRNSQSPGTPVQTTPTAHFARSLSDPSAFQTPERSDRAKGKRKAEEVDVTPPEQKASGQKATSFQLPSDPRTHRSSTPPHAPSSYHRKRARLSSPLPTPVHSRPGSAQPQNLTAHNTGTASSRTSSRHPAANASFTRGTSMRSARASIDRGSDRDRRQSLSGVSIPISALVTPHAPSVARTSQFHMRDPRRPPKKLETPWSLRRRTDEEDGSPVQAWLFFIGFVLFPLWWLAAVLPTPQTRQVGGSDTEKAVTLDDPQIEFDAKSWRFRCRIMSVVSLFTYIPFIVLVAIFAPR
ncbi:hypothetical protein DENSPDRAFT_838294 [Dentipellis sp. KUC8613]|nr:hypothetical protein DENSPDRAFT_838294 [Dentipellis sp. KUC8613]